MKRYFVFIMAIITLSCQTASEPVLKQMEGVFAYTAYDSNYKVIVTGTLIISQTDSTQIKGTWQLAASDNAQNTGPQNGMGTLAGTINKETVGINLNPGFADNNVLLQGTANTLGFSGTWEWIGFAGRLNGGSFNASRSKN